MVISQTEELFRGCRQGDPISPYIFVKCAEVLSHVLRECSDVKGINVEGMEVKLSQYADDTTLYIGEDKNSLCTVMGILDTRFRNPPIGSFKHVECLSGTPWIVSLEKTWFFQLCMIASTLFWSNSMDTFNGPIVLRIHF